jgi:hypothetical protein
LIESKTQAGIRDDAPTQGVGVNQNLMHSPGGSVKNLSHF